MMSVEAAVAASKHTVASPQASVDSSLVDEEEAIKLFLEFANGQSSIPISWRDALKFLRARKFNQSQTRALYEAYYTFCSRERISDLSPFQDPDLCIDIASGKMTLLKLGCEAEYSVALYTVRLHTPETSVHCVMRSLIYQLDVLTSDEKVQSGGVVLILDMSGIHSKDVAVSLKVINTMQGIYPVLLVKVFVVEPPLWFRLVYTMVSTVRGTRERVFLLNSRDYLADYLPLEHFPQHLGGGAAQLEHRAWLLRCLQFHPDSNVHDINKFLSDADGASEDEDSQDAVPAATLGPAKWELLPMPQSDDDIPSPLGSTSSSGTNTPDSARQWMTPQELVDHIRMTAYAGLLGEYMSLRHSYPTAEYTISKIKENSKKNRYPDVPCLDATRVPLTTGENSYIHANFVAGFYSDKEFISTQGPLPHTCHDFWRMVWEQESRVVVMTTRVIEKNRNKCAQYWPVGVDEDMCFQEFFVLNESVELERHWTVTRLKLTHGDVTRSIMHLHFTSWPDHGVPEVQPFLDFTELLMSLRERGSDEEPPVVVHCSAGVGRTGTLCTVNTCINQLESEMAAVNIYSVVSRMRSERAISVQTVDQYIFCYTAIVMWAQSKGLIEAVKTSDFDDTLSVNGDSGALWS